MRIRWKALAAGLAAVAVFGLAGCGDTGKTVEPRHEGGENPNFKFSGGGGAAPGTGASQGASAGASLKKGS